MLYYYIYIIIYRGKTKASRRKGRERTRAKDAAAIFASSSPLFCSVCCIHRPHHRQPLTTSPACVIAQGEGRAATSSTSGRCHRHHIAAPLRRSISSSAAPRRSAIMPASSPSSSFPRRRPLLQVVREGHRASQGGAIPCRSSCRASPPCRGASAYCRTPPETGRGSCRHIRAARLVRAIQSFGNFCAVVSL